MKSIYKIFMTTVFSIGSLGLVTLTSCKKSETTDPSKTPTATTKESDKFVGKWGASDVTVDGTYPYDLEIKAGTDSKSVTIVNISEMDDIVNLNATVSGTTLTIPSQKMGGGDYQFIKGSGTLDAASNKISITYTLTPDNGNPDRPYTGVWSKK